MSVVAVLMIALYLLSDVGTGVSIVQRPRAEEPAFLHTAWTLQVIQGLVMWVIAVAIAASCGFATPMGYQTNMMVYGPGGYRFGDYLRFGGPLNLLTGAITIAIAPLIWKF